MWLCKSIEKKEKKGEVKDVQVSQQLKQ